MDDAVPVGRREDFQPGDIVGCKVGELDVAIVNHNGELSAFSDFCPHEAVTLSAGYGLVTDGFIVCMLHSSLFEIGHGEVCAGPAPTGLTKYPLQIIDDVVYVSPTPEGSS